MRKRSSTVALTILGAASFALAGCKEEQVDAQAFPDLASCQAAATDGGLFTADQCQQAFADAETLHVEAAPRYESLAVCEEQHGEGNCGSEAEQVQNGGSGSIFMPLLAGYLIGSMLGRAGGGMAASQPMYRNASGGFTNAARTSSFSANQGRATMGAQQFTRPAATAGKAPMTRATAASRGGFGGTGGSRGFGG
ncbi:DUF1190 domain-containing protein [Paracoccus sp. R12_1]|jgi:uncharacterized protein YgiB involved in biofilm formation|uniref:DUF1190 domain-containing protein n=1 Tax=Paracoccus maritimus TaxID=2933292 RepID=A0ABT2K4J2_9RHOB|nr:MULTISPECIES: DUF1190 domain-containing protein [unclassified Paracoccus (in: a-proteobacteria)]MBO9453891.1 DUF1190 domain-containing protein [Paracoccus sp. R12_2]MBO9485761.1 DUF1190 domain-containing protein [Paracoccus sp. R12_1]MCT4331449.1 DUF1190 domain-containing protein [Paracoccus sp. YLB-12]